MDSIKLFLILVIIIVILHKCFSKEKFIILDKTHENKVKKCCKGNNCKDKPVHLNKNCEENKIMAKNSLNKHFNYSSLDCKNENFEATNPAIDDIYKNLEGENINRNSENKLKLSIIPSEFYKGTNYRKSKNKKKLKASNDNIQNYYPKK